MATKEQIDFWNERTYQEKVSILEIWYCDKYVWDIHRKACLKEAKEFEKSYGKDTLEQYKNQIKEHIYNRKPIEF